MKFNKKRVISILGVFAGAAVLSGCATVAPLKPQDFTQSTKVVTKTKIIKPALEVIAADFNYHQSPAVRQAYKKFMKTGQTNPVSTKGFIAYPFRADSQPIILDQPLQIVDIRLEPGEVIEPKGIAVGDSSNWKFDILTSQNDGLKVEHLIFKPMINNTATDVVLATNKRTYHFGLLSKEGADIKAVRFWYPEEMEKKAMENINSQQQQASKNETNVIADVPNINIHNLNFNYTLSGDNPTWKPVRVFSDNVHTYIQFPSSVEHGNLPVLYTYSRKSSEKQLVNYRDKGNYFVVDGVYPEMVLILGRPGYFFNLFDDRQEIVYVNNNNMSA